MTKYYNNTNYTGSSPFSKVRRKNPWIRILKIFCWFVGVIIIISGILIWVFALYYSPERITKLIEKESNRYLKADISIGKLDYKLYHTYPWIEFEVDSLTVISKSLEGIPKQLRDSIPSNSDSLLSVTKLSGKINIHDLIHKKISLKDIDIKQPKINIVVVDDSISNFDVVLHPISHNFKLPDFDISEISIQAPLEIDYFSLPQRLNAEVNVEDFYLIRNVKDYTIGFNGKIDGTYKGYSLPGKIPVKLNTILNLDFPDLSLLCKDLSVTSDGIDLNVRGEVSVNKKEINLEDIELHIKVNDIFKIIQYLPQQFADLVVLPEGFSGSLPLDLTASLHSPYQIDTFNIHTLSQENIPFFSALLKVENARLSFIPPEGEKIEANDVFLEASCEYDPENPENTNIRVKELRLSGEGINLSGNTQINNLTGSQQGIKGYFNFGSSLVKTISYFFPNLGLNIGGHLEGNVNFDGIAINLGRDGLKNIILDGVIKSKSLGLNSARTGDLKLKRFKGHYKIDIPSYPLSNYSGTNLDFDFDVDTILTKNKSSKAVISGLNLNVEVKDTVSGNPNPYGILSLHMNSMSAQANKNRLKAENIDLKTTGILGSEINVNYSVISETSGANDALIESRIQHTPLVLEYNGNNPLQSLYNIATLNADMTVGNGSLISPNYLMPINFSDVSLSTNLNKVRLKAAKIIIGSSGCSLSGEINGIKPFITSYTSTPLNALLDIDFTNVDINELSWGYFGALIAQGNDSVFTNPPMKPFTAADSLCIAIPRNISADIRLRSESAQYMQYSFSPLSTDIIIRDGIASLRNLTIGTPYCKTVVDWTYSTKSLDNIFMSLNAEVKDFSFTDFYKVFPSILNKATELQYFSGQIDASVDCKFDMFPDMFMDFTSLKGNLVIKGKNLELAREGKIERITHLMLIEGDQPIKLQNINISGAFHDNLFQLNPFKISFDDYMLDVAGLNNVDGEMYYHFALEKSPFHLPFGLTLFGKMKHPEIRLGGTHIDDFKSEKVSSDIQSNININIMAYLKHGWNMFIQEAAKYRKDHQ